jgi:hypothetical protein
MSESVELEVIIVGMAALIEAITNSGLRHEQARELRTEAGAVHPVDLVVTDEQGAQVGVKLDSRTGKATFVGHERADRRATTLVNRISQQYAYSRALEELKRKGYQIAREEKQRDGTIKIVAQRWR